MKKKTKKYICGGIITVLLFASMPSQIMAGANMGNVSDTSEMENEVSSNDNGNMENIQEEKDSSNEIIADVSESSNSSEKVALEDIKSFSEIKKEKNILNNQENLDIVMHSEEYVTANDRAATYFESDQLSLNKKYSARTFWEDDSIHSNIIEFELKKAGRIQFLFNHCIDPDYSIYTYPRSWITGVGDINFTMKNSQAQERAYSNWVSLPPGEYEISFTSRNSINYETDFCIKYEEEGTYDGEVEDNGTFDTANKLPLNTNFWGTSDLYGYDVDYFYFEIKNSSKVEISISDPDVQWGRLYAEDRYENIELITNCLYDTNNRKYFMPVMRLSKGKYFLEVSPRNNSAYHIYIESTKENAKLYEQENNNLFSKANKNQVNKWYTGNINLCYKSYEDGTNLYENDVDWYQFKVSKKSYVATELKVPRQVDGRVIATLYSSSKKKIMSIKSEDYTRKPYIKSKKKLVEPGTYYICVKSDSSYSPVYANTLLWDYQIRLLQKNISKKL